LGYREILKAAEFLGQPVWEPEKYPDGTGYVTVENERREQKN